MEDPTLLVIGAGPYGLAVAARAIERGIRTLVVGHPMGFWTDHMPTGMLLRSGLDWHLDASNVHTFQAFIEESGISAADIDPVPIGVFRNYATWFQNQKQLVVHDALVTGLTKTAGKFAAQLVNGAVIEADVVVCAPGSGNFQQLPHWATAIPDPVGVHTCDLVQFDELADARILIVGGRQSAYEWAALLGEHGAAKVDIVHRHDVPQFERVSWKFMDAYVDATLASPGWWRSLATSEQDAVARQFWQVGRRTLEWWLTPRISGERFHRWPGTHVVEVAAENNAVAVTLSNAERIRVDRIIYATGYKTDLTKVPYLRQLGADIDLADGSPVLTEAFQSSVAGLYFTGAVATRDFGPFFGFTKACPAAATIIVDDLLRRTNTNTPIK